MSSGDKTVEPLHSYALATRLAQVSDHPLSLNQGTVSPVKHLRSERQRASHGSGAGSEGPRERACKGVRGTKSPRIRRTMRFRMGRRALLACAALVTGLALMPVSAQQAQERVDYDAIFKIKEEGFQRSKVMEITSWLTDVYGPRLTNS